MIGIRARRIIREHAIRAWREAGGDREKLAESLHEVAARAREEAVGIGIIPIILTVFSVIQFLVWLYDRWHKSPPEESDLCDVEAMGMVSFA